MKNQTEGQPTIVKYIEPSCPGIQLLNLSRCAIGYVVRGHKNIYYGDKHYFEVAGERRFDQERIEDFCREHGIALYDAACQVRRLKDNASDKFLEIVQATDIEALIESMPHCRAVAATGQKAVEIISDLFSCEIPRIGESRNIVVCGRSLSLWRMPSSSRAYPLALEKKAESYAYMAQTLEL